MIVQVGIYPEPIGGISIYIKRMKQYLDSIGIKNQIWDYSNIQKNVSDVLNIKFKYIPFKYMFSKNVDLIHYNICGIKSKLYIGFFNEVFFRRRKKILTIHGDSKNLFVKNDKLMIKTLNSFNAIICVKSGDKNYLTNKGIHKPVYEIPAFLFPRDKNDDDAIPGNIFKFFNSKNFIISANASSIRFNNGQDLYGIDMCVELAARLSNKYKDVGFIFCMPCIDNLDYYNKMLRVIKEKNIDDYFIFLIENMELYPIIKKSKLFLRPTNTDGYSVSLAEAIYYKVPVIASDVCKRPEGTILFKNRNIDDLCNKTIDVIEKYKQYKDKVENIEIKDNAEKILHIYKKVIGQ